MRTAFHSTDAADTCVFYAGMGDVATPQAIISLLHEDWMGLNYYGILSRDHIGEGMNDAHTEIPIQDSPYRPVGRKPIRGDRRIIHNTGR